MIAMYVRVTYAVNYQQWPMAMRLQYSMCTEIENCRTTEYDKGVWDSCPSRRYDKSGRKDSGEMIGTSP